MQYSSLTVKPAVLKDEPLSHKEAAKRMSKFLKKVREVAAQRRGLLLVRRSFPERLV